MLLAILYILALSFNNTTAFSYRIDDVILKFIVNATPVLFPPLRISMHLCIDYKDTIKLSRQMSNYYLTHSIHNFVKDFDSRIYNNLEHQNLYVLDLNCDYAIEVLRQAHSKRMFIAPTKWLFVQDRRMVIANSGNANLTSTYNDSMLEVFENIAVYPDSDVVLARRYDNDFLELISIYRPSPQRRVMWEERGNWTIENGLRMRTFDVASARRRNLQQTALKSCIVVTNPNTVNHLTDFEDVTVDSLTKVIYPTILHLVDRMNATVSFQVTNTWGYSQNGSYSGMIGMLQQHEIDIGGTAVAMTTDRLNVIQYIQLYVEVGAYFIFRRPLLSRIKNIFILPFKPNVWIAIAVFLVVVFCLLSLSMKWEEYTLRKSTTHANRLNFDEHIISHNLLVLLGACTQQGISYEPHKISTRIITFMLLITSLSLYTSYTANIVTLLQTTTDSIKTLSDLLHSSLTLGVYDNVYNRYFFKTYKDPIRKAITEQKIESKDRKSSGWMSIEKGVDRIRHEPFAFHASWNKIYYIMRRTYREEEKCGLSEIDYLGLVYPLLIIQKQSPYSEIIKNGALKLREYGLKYRYEHRLYKRKLVCSNRNSFITIGFMECYFAIVIMGYGMLFSVVVLIFELMWYKRQNKNTKRKKQLQLIKWTNKMDRYRRIA